MVSLLKFFSPAPLGTSPVDNIHIPPPTVTLAETRRPPALGPISATGITEYAGFLHYPHEKDQAWSDQFARDQTIMEMSNNPILGSVLRQIAMFIRQVPWTLNPANESEEAMKVRDFFQEQLDGMDNLWPGETMPQILTFLSWGWACLEIIYKQLPDGRIGWEQWRLIPQETRWKWIFNSMGEATHLVQRDFLSNNDINIPLNRVIHIRDTSRGNSPEGFTIFRIVYDAYFYRSGFQQLEGTLFERYGGVQVARLPADDIENNSDSYQELKRIVTTLNVNAQTGMVLASNRDPATGEYYQEFDIVSPASGATVPSADPIINRYANELVGVFGAAVTRTGQDGSGSYALADVQSEVFIRNMEAYLDLARDCIQTQAFPRLAAMPYNNIPPELIPTLVHGKLDKVALKDMGTYLVSLAQSGTLFESPELTKYVHEQASLPVPPVEDIKKQMDKEERDAKKLAADTLKAQKSSQDATQQGVKIEAAKPESTKKDSANTQKLNNASGS